MEIGDEQIDDVEIEAGRDEDVRVAAGLLGFGVGL